MCGQTESIDAAAAALTPLPIEAAGTLLQRDGDGVRAAVELEPYGDWWVVADLSAGLRPGRPLPPDHVLGVGGASITLAGATLRHPVGTALDLGTGCGVQALHLSTHAQRVTATDLSARALRFAATTAALNGLDWDLLRGRPRRAGAGPPLRPRRVQPAVHRRPGRAALRLPRLRPGRRRASAPSSSPPRSDLLNPGGHVQFLANWLHVAGEDWLDRVAGWLAGTGLDAWVIQREVSDPVGYVNLWLADAAEDAARQPAVAAAWLDWFDAAKVEAVGFGLVTLRAGGHDDPTVRIEDLRQPLDAPLGPEVARLVRAAGLAALP